LKYCFIHNSFEEKNGFATTLRARCEREEISKLAPIASIPLHNK
jgi:hypothetical protein